MPKLNPKDVLIEEICINAFEQMEYLSSDEDEKMDEKIDEIFDEAFDELTLILENRYLSPRITVRKTKVWWERVLPKCEDRVFKNELRVSRQNFHKILSLIKDDELFTRKQLGVELQLAVALSRFGQYGNASSILKKASRFGVGEGTVQLVTLRVIDAILKLKDRYLRWPSVEERQQICDYMRDKLPNCVGYIDGTDVKLTDKPIDDPPSYLSKKNIYAIKAQVVVDNNRRIRDLMVGYPGSVNDGLVFGYSKISQKSQCYFSKGQYMIGDAAYPCSEFLISTPRKNTEDLSEADRKAFIRHVEKYRRTADNTIVVLKEIFQSLKALRIRVSKSRGHADACKWIFACCILYNILMPDPREYGLDLNKKDDCGVVDDDQDSEDEVIDDDDGNDLEDVDIDCEDHDSEDEDIADDGHDSEDVDIDAECEGANVDLDSEPEQADVDDDPNSESKDADGDDDPDAEDICSDVDFDLEDEPADVDDDSASEDRGDDVPDTEIVNGICNSSDGVEKRLKLVRWVLRNQ